MEENLIILKGFAILYNNGEDCEYEIENICSPLFGEFKEAKNYLNSLIKIDYTIENFEELNTLKQKTKAIKTTISVYVNELHTLFIVPYAHGWASSEDEQYRLYFPRDEHDGERYEIVEDSVTVSKKLLIKNN